jgi:ABC-type lipoprotein export system ATPase subunit
MLSFNNVTKNYRLDRDIIITPVNNVNIQIERGEFIVIIGRSGTGKTTLLNLAAGLVKPSSGRVTIDNQDLGRLNDKQLSLLRSREIGFVFQFPSLLPSLNILDNVSLPAIFTGGKGEKDANSRAAHILDKLGLAEKLNVYPGQLSAGEQKRVVIARSLINGPQLILADEPTSDLDSRTETEVMNIFREINSRGITFLIVTHNLDLVNFATRAFEMQNGGMKEIVNTGVMI